MPELICGERRWPVASGDNLLDALLQAGVAVPYSCRAGSCQACRVRCLAGEPADAQPEALDADLRAHGWRLACQCRVAGDLVVEVQDLQREGIPARVESLDWPGGEVLRLRLIPERPLRYQAGQHLLLWAADGIARPYSLASLPGEAPWLEFHLACHRPGAFSDAARRLQPGDMLRLGALRSGALHYDPAWTTQPLWLLASGTGLAPLWGVLREALRQGHEGSIRVIHLARPGAHYLAGPLAALADRHEHLSVDLLEDGEWPAGLRPSRQTVALVCGRPDFVEACGRRLFLAGLPRRQVLADAFVTAGSKN